jgi:imidazolonepropionase-like amidohydrolase
LISYSGVLLAQQSVIYAGELLFEPGESPDAQQTIVIEDGSIKSVHNGYLSLAELNMKDGEVEILDFKDSFILPGLIDAHVHLLNNANEKFRQSHVSNEEKLINGVINSRLTLEAGFTTVADLDAVGHGWSIIVLRNAINAGRIPGPRVFTASDSISPTGGHGDFLDRPDEELNQLETTGLCDGKEACRRAVRKQFRQGADLIKIMASGGGFERTGDKHHEPSFSEEEFKTIVETAHGLDLKVTAHAHGTAGINAALEAGVDSIEHGSFLDSKSISLFKKSGAYLIPTLSAQDLLRSLVDTAPDNMQQRLQMYMSELPGNVLKAYKAGVKLANGSDAGAVPHGNGVRELEWLVQVGISESDAIKIATINSAAHLGKENLIGQVKPGMQADIIAVSGNPLQNISDLRQVRLVMKNGRIYKRD